MQRTTVSRDSDVIRASRKNCSPSRGVWDEKGQWLPVPYIDTTAAEKLFAHKILRLLKSKDLLSDERLQLLLSFRNSGFSVDTSPAVWPQDTQGLERLCRYLLRCPVSISRIHWTPGSRTLFYESKGSHDDPLLSHPKGESIDIFEFIARVLTQIPEPRKHGVHYYVSRYIVTTLAPTLRGRGFFGTSAASPFTPLVTTTTRNQRPKPSSHQKNVPPSEKVGPSSSNASIKSIL